MIELTEIDEDNFEECIELELHDEQWSFVATNAYSLAEAYAISKDGKDFPIPLAIYDNDCMVGFIMAVYQPIGDNDPEDDENVYFLPRMMIDKRYQGKGFGKSAMIEIIELLKSQVYGIATVIVLSCDRSNTRAYNLYCSLGFVDTGEYDEDGDVYMRLEL